MFISRVRLQRIRGFKDLDLWLRSDGNQRPRLHTVLIGKNGTCKTTFLRAVAIGLADRKDASGLLAEPTGVLVAEEAKDAEILIELTSAEAGEKPITLRTTIGLDDEQDVLLDKSGESAVNGLLVCGYGIGRTIEGPDVGRAYRLIDSVYTMFQYEGTLMGTELALRRMRDYLGQKRYPKAMTGIKRALGLSARDKIELSKGGGVVVSGASIGKSIPIEGWADGYRKTLNWIIDLYGWAMRANAVTDDGGIRGILLIDEIEQHLHPSMQTSLLARLRTLFKDLQIIATTHSPLVVLGTASSDEVIVLDRKRKYVEADCTLPDFAGYSAEDVLVDPRIFDSDVYGPKTNRQRSKYRALTAKSASKRTAKEKTELRKLATELSAQQLPVTRQNDEIQKLQALLKKHKL